MKFICNKLELSKAISNVSKAVPQKSAIQALAGIKIKVSNNVIKFTAYNLEMGIFTTINANTEGSGEFVANSHILNEFIKKMPNQEEITIEVDSNNNVQINCITTKCSFHAISAEEYPDLPIIVNSQKRFFIRQKTLRSMINMTSYAISHNATKPIFTGELFDINNGNFNLVAMDGFRIAIRNEPYETNENCQFIVPQRVLKEVANIINDVSSDTNCNIIVNNHHIIFEINNLYVISRLLEGSFYQYKKNIPTNYKTEIIVNKYDFLTCLERCSLIINEKNKSPVQCKIDNRFLKITCKTSIGYVNDTVYANISGENLTINFNHRFILEALKAAEGDNVRIHFNGNMKVIEILPLEGKSYIYLVMPIQPKK